MARAAHAGARQRRVRRRVPRFAARSAPVHRARLARSLRLMAAGSREAHRRRPGHHRRSRDRHAPRRGRRRQRDREGSQRTRGIGGEARRPADRRGTRPRAAGRAADAALRPAGLRGRAPGRPRGRGRSRARALLVVVRALPALRERLARAPRHVRRCREAPALRLLDGLRRALPAAHPSDRALAPQGPEQRRREPRRRPRQPLGDRRVGGGPHGHPPRARHVRRTSTTSLRPRRRAASRSRSTSPSSAHPITPGCTSIPSGSATGPTAPSSTPRTLPSAIRTSTRSSSSARSGPRSGTRCSRSSASGSATASASSGSTTRTRSRSCSGSG